MTYQSVNPYNGEVLASFHRLTNSELEMAMDSAHNCFEDWKNRSFANKAIVLLKAAEIMRDDVDYFATLITLEMGKLIEQARGEVLLSVDIITYYAEHAEAFLAPVDLKQKIGEAQLLSSPIGLLFGVQPWNFPYYQLARFAAPNLMVGNVVLVKHAGSVPQCALAFEKLLRDAGAPKGAYTNLFIDYKQSDVIIADLRIKGVALTGSVDAGKIVATQAGKNLKKTTMELGGSDAFIVLEDADLELAVQWAVWAKMNNTGQSCVAAKRFIVVEPLAELFLEKFKAGLSTLTAGDPMDAATTLGPLSSEAALLGLLKQVKQALKHGATLVLGGKRADRIGAFMQPTILSNISPDNPAYSQEFFGPVALFFSVKDEEEAITLANDSEFGLGGSVFSKDIDRAKRVASLIDAGMVFINQPTWTAPDLPFGGIKNSGYGRELSSLGIQEFVNKKLVRVSNAAAPN
jgi:succinate-semialdehyde dehydrogenase / glutarate-semialdehyde dehydrogenase